MCEAQSDRQQFLEPWAPTCSPHGRPQEHVEDVTAGAHEYTVVQGGTMDGENCCPPWAAA